MTRSAELWLISRSCHRAISRRWHCHVTRVPAREAFAGDGIAFVWHGARTLALCRYSSASILRCVAGAGTRWPSARCLRRRWRWSEFRVDVHHDLSRSAPAGPSLRRTYASIFGDRCACADCADSLPMATRGLRVSSRSCAAKLVVHQGHLEAEGGRLGVDAVAAADHRSVHVLARLGPVTFRRP